MSITVWKIVNENSTLFMTSMINEKNLVWKILKYQSGDCSMNQLLLHVIFIHIRSDQQLSRLFPSLQKKQYFYTRSYRHFKI